MRRCQVFSPEDLDLMSKVFSRACDGMPGEQPDDTQRTQLAKAVVITYRTRHSESALAAAALHLVDLKLLN